MANLFDMSGRPWLLDHRAQRRLAHSVARRLKFRGLPSAADVTQLRTKKLLAARNRGGSGPGGLAVLDINGGIEYKTSLFSWLGLGTSTADCEEILRCWLADPNVKNILLRFDSPGGEETGLRQFADFVREARDQKPIYGLIDPMACSAACWICSATLRTWAIKDSETASIGSYSLHADLSGALQRAGVKISILCDPAGKATGNPYEPLAAEDAEFILDQVRETTQRFQMAVAKNRRTTLADVRANYGGGRVMGAAAALDAGLIDEVLTGTASQFIGKLAAGQISKLGRRAALVTGKRRMEPGDPGSREDQQDSEQYDGEKKEFMEECMLTKSRDQCLIEWQEEMARRDKEEGEGSSAARLHNAPVEPRADEDEEEFMERCQEAGGTEEQCQMAYDESAEARGKHRDDDDEDEDDDDREDRDRLTAAGNGPSMHVLRLRQAQRQRESEVLALALAVEDDSLAEPEFDAADWRRRRTVRPGAVDEGSSSSGNYDDAPLPTIVGYAAVFLGSEYGPRYGDGNEQILAGAFDAVLRKRGNIRGLMDHNAGKVVGSVAQGNLEVRADDCGLLVICRPTGPHGRQLVDGIRRGTITGMSYSRGLALARFQYRSCGPRLHQVAAIDELDEVSFMSDPPGGDGPGNPDTCCALIEDLRGEAAERAFIAGGQTPLAREARRALTQEARRLSWWRGLAV